MQVECRAGTPASRAMSTESLAPGVNSDHFAAFVVAEIELREGYEGELWAAIAE